MEPGVLSYPGRYGGGMHCLQRLKHAPPELYKAQGGAVNVTVFFQGGTVWSTQRILTALFGVGVPAITRHLKNIFDPGELDREATVSKMETVPLEGDRQVLRQADFYHLDAIIAVGQRVNKFQATQFRIWATRTRPHSPPTTSTPWGQR